MAQVLVSPGVLTREFDLTIRPADTTGIGACIVAPRAKGPAFTPLKLKDLEQDVQLFGLPDNTGRDYGAYGSRAYLKQSTAPLNFMRILGRTNATNTVVPGYTIGGDGDNKGLYVILASGSNVVAVIASSGAVTLQGTLTSSVSELAVNIAGTGSFTCSLNRTDKNYIKNVLNTDPTQFSTKKHWVWAVYDYAKKTPVHNNAFAVVGPSAGTHDFTDDYVTGSTTNVISQPFDNQEYNLFGIGSIFAGESANYEIKVSIQNIKKSVNTLVSDYGSFTVLVRLFDDSDRAVQVLETFTNCNLDPNDRNYVLKRIGDRYTVWNSTTKKFDEFGEYPNQSKYIYLIPSTDLVNGNVPATALPFGFRGYRTPNDSNVTNKNTTWPAMPLVQDSTFNGQFNSSVYWGVEVFDNSANTANHGIRDKLKHLPAGFMGASGSNDSIFSLKYVSGSVTNVSGYSVSSRLDESDISSLSTSLSYSVTGWTNPATTNGWLSLDNIENTALAKFTMPIMDGFDGTDITKKNKFDPENMGSATTYESHAYLTAVDILSNPETIDFNVISLPGVHKTAVTNQVINLVEDRGDAFYVHDLSGSTVDDVISDLVTRNLDTNYAGGYYPWVKLIDDTSDRIVRVPPGVIIPAVFAFNDRVSFPWYAPAGFGRGGLRAIGVTEAVDKLTQNDRNRLYENRINPIGTFSGEGVVVWGQKTFQLAESALTRINVRRLMLTLRKTIARIAVRLVFEPNVASTWAKFSNQVKPFLASVQQNYGLEDFRVILDERSTTKDDIDRNIMRGKIAVKPTRSAEFIYLDFFITNNVAGFEE